MSDTFTYMYQKKSTIHVGKYTSPMDGMGIPNRTTHSSFLRNLQQDPVNGPLNLSI